MREARDCNTQLGVTVPSLCGHYAGIKGRSMGPRPACWMPTKMARTPTTQRTQHRQMQGVRHDEKHSPMLYTM